MKKVKLITGLLLILASHNLSLAQGGGAYKQLQVPKDNISQSLQNIGRNSAQQSAENRMRNEQIREYNISKYNKHIKLGIDFYRQQKYSECIYEYETSKNLGFYDSDFEYVTGISYYQIFKNTGKKKYMRKSKKILKLSKRHGNINARTFLDENFQ